MRKPSVLLALAAALTAAAVLPLCAQPPAAAPAAAGVAASDPATVLYPQAPAAAGGAKAIPALGGTATMLLVVLAGAAGGWLLWQRLRSNARPSGRSEHQLAVAETKSLGNRQYLVVAAYGERRFLLGVCPGKIDLIAPLDGAPPPAP
jgi:flagellar protein FliO/FliZ